MNVGVNRGKRSTSKKLMTYNIMHTSTDLVPSS